MARKIVRLGTRESPLAMIQTKMVMKAIQQADPSIDVRLVSMKTTGDILASARLSDFGGKGLFVKELDAALLTKKVDLTVHSFKDVPMDLPDELPIIATSNRADPRDVLVLPLQKNENKKRTNFLLGCSSQRRSCQLRELFPNAAIEPVRGNVQTRLRKLNEGKYSALVLAAAGLSRLGLSTHINRFFSIKEILPAACQGILAVQARRGESFPFLMAFHSADSLDAATAERAFVRALGGGCGTPVAAYAQIQGTECLLRGLFLHEPSGKIWRGQLSGSRSDAENLGTQLAQKAKQAF